MDQIEIILSSSTDYEWWQSTELQEMINHVFSKLHTTKEFLYVNAVSLTTKLISTMARFYCH